MAERILVVEDEEPIRDIIVSMLRTAKYECQEAGSGFEALELLASDQRFDLVLSNLMMANLDGMGLLERVKEKYPDIPLVMVTAVHDISVALAAIRNGAFDYLLKPFDVHQLLAAVRRALEYGRLKSEDRNYRMNLESLVKERTDQLQAQTRATEQSYDMTLKILGEALDLREGTKGSHSKRVTAFTIGMAKNLGLPLDQIAIIARGAFLHDIGKMAIPDGILTKPGPLTPQETLIMQEHCFKGRQLVSKIPFLQEASEIVYAHHEFYDGTGYPRGMKGKEIPLGARIVAVANTLDSITTNLPHRKARTFAEARIEIQGWSGRQFDPEIVAVFQKMPDDTFEGLRRAIDSPPQS